MRDLIRRSQPAMITKRRPPPQFRKVSAETFTRAWEYHKANVRRARNSAACPRHCFGERQCPELRPSSRFQPDYERRTDRIARGDTSSASPTRFSASAGPISSSNRSAGTTTFGEVEAAGASRPAQARLSRSSCDFQSDSLQRYTWKFPAMYLVLLS